MKRLLGFVSLLLLCGPCHAEEHVWSKHGSFYPLIVANEAAELAQPIDVFSPDHRKHLHIEWEKTSPGGDAGAVLTIVVDSAHEVLSNKECNQVEVLWSPGSENIALTCGISAITNSTYIYHLTSHSIQAMPLAWIWRDMAVTYPPCKAKNADPESCRLVMHGDRFNYATLAWSDDNTAVVMAEVPCSSSWGGIMCQIEGYEVDAKTGTVLRRLTARQLKKQWQPALAFRLRIPDPPVWSDSSR